MYFYPKFDGIDFYKFRIGGPGLANLLFPWARCYVDSLRHMAPMLRPTWPQLKMGPFLRAEIDSRSYVGLMRHMNDEVGGVRKMMLLVGAEKCSEKEFVGFTEKSKVIIEYTGMSGFFDYFLNDNLAIYDRLSKYCYEDFSDIEEYHSRYFIGVHVRMGDFAISEDPEKDLRMGKSNVRLPLKWYADKIKFVRQEHGANLPVFLFSDGNETELAELLKIDGTRLIRRRDALADMLTLSRAKYLICSNSTYSMWAAFLSNSKSYWFPGSLRTAVNADKKLAIEIY